MEALLGALVIAGILGFGLFLVRRKTKDEGRTLPDDWFEDNARRGGIKRF